MSESRDVIYIGDPQCSWCWGIAEEMKKIQTFVTGHDMNFTIIVGGLRVGGGQAWDAEFKDMLRHHWQQVNQRSGQPFDYGLFDLPEFDYDTEPSCRAVVTAKNLIVNSDLTVDSLLDFFVAIQHKFYVGNQDPKQLEFYASICSDLGLDFAEFSKLYQSEDIKGQTTAEFNITRNWGVSGYPTILYTDGKQLYMVSSGFQKADSIIENMQQLIGLA
uniref:DsbA family protein n=1 Tax=OCS116 cluster bacterium TaxID=2030921 RepID=A0A2A4YYG7_9PROT